MCNTMADSKSDESPESYVSVALAGKITGIPVRTVHYWVTTGKVRIVAGGPNARGKLVRLGDVQRVARHATATQVHAHRVHSVAQDLAASGTDDSDATTTQVRNTDGNELLHMVRDLQRQNVELAGQVGYLQRVVQERDEQLQLLLAAPNEGQEDRAEGDGETVAAIEQRRPWWRFLQKIGR